MVEEKYIIQGDPPDRLLEDGTAGSYLHNVLKKYKNRNPCMTAAETGESISYKDLLENTCRLAQSFLNYGYPINTVISICSENSIYYMYPVIAALYTGLIMAPINPHYTEREFLQLYGITKPQLVFCSKKYLIKILEIKEKLPFIKKVVLIDAEEDTSTVECMNSFISRGCGENFNIDNFRTVDFNRDEHTALIMRTSGTTGLPKGAMITHGNLMHKFNNSRNPAYGTGLCVEPGGSVLNSSPLYHSLGCTSTLDYITLGHHMVQMEKFDEKLFLASIEKYKTCSILLLSSTVVTLLKSTFIDKYDISSLIEIVSGGSPLAAEVFRAIKERLKLKHVRHGYGLTELSTIVCITPINSTKYESVGKLLPFVSAKVLDIETSEALGPNQFGEICLRGATLMKGYFENEEATKNTIDEGGWLHTGDAGYYDEHKYIYITDRIKELIKYNSIQARIT
ncbi:hypothetical protein FQA39_LY08447 [Lamprigera yunnana]|nr:hypothetical protein FQA39_LY08447 [Lamprigera yunnana]